MVSRYRPRSQESEYLQQVEQSEQVITSENRGLGKGDYRRAQFDLAEVTRGGGRAVWSVGDRGQHFRSLNRVFDLPETNRFTPELRAKILEFQRQKVESDPTWQALERSLNSKGKTLIDGLVGTMTLEAIISDDLVAVQRSRLVVDRGDRREDQRGSHSDNGSSNRIARIDQDRIEQARIEQARLENARQERLRLEQARLEQAKADQLKAEQARIDQIRLAEQQRLEAARIEKLTGDLEGARARLVIATKELDTRAAANEANYKSFTSSDLVKMHALLDKFNKDTPLEVMSGLRSSTSSEVGRYQYSQLQSRADAAMSTMTEELKLARGVDTQLRTRIDTLTKQIDRLLATTPDTATCDKLVRELDSLNPLIKSGRGHAILIERAYADTRLTPAEKTNVIKATQLVTQFFKDQEGFVNAQTSGDIDEMRKVAKSYLVSCGARWSDSTASSGDGGAPDSLEVADFCKVFCKHPGYASELIGAFDTSYGSGRLPLFLALELDGNRERYLKALQGLVDQTNPRVSNAKRIEEYLSAIKWAEDNKITNPFRFSIDGLVNLMKDSKQKDYSKPLLVVVAGSSDWNGALNQLEYHIEKFRSQGYRVEYREVSSDQDISLSMQSATSNGQYKADAVILSGHGSRRSLSLADRDPRLFKVDPSDRVITFDDEAKLKDVGKYIESGASMILYSCSNGNGREGTENMANFMRKVFPHIAPKRIFSMTEPGYIINIEFDADKKVKKVTFDGKYNPETYQSSTGDSHYDSAV